MKGLNYFLIFILLLPFVSPWSTPPPQTVEYKGTVYIDGVKAPDGSILTMWDNDDANLMDSITLSYGNGYYDHLQIRWDDPETATDEGVLYGGVEHITFKLNDKKITNPEYVTVTTSDAGSIKYLDLNYTTPPTPAVPVAAPPVVPPPITPPPPRRIEASTVMPKIIYVGEPFTITVYGFDYKGQKQILSNADVEVYRKGSWILIEIGVTNEQGEFTFTPNETGDYKIVAKKYGFTTQEIFFTVIGRPKLEVAPPSIPVPPVTIKPAVIIDTRLLLVLLSIIIFTIIFIYAVDKLKARKKVKEKQSKYTKKLVGYITNAINEGYSKTKIKKNLIKTGWPKKIVDNYCDHLWQQYKKS